jgi:hypothetical protein
MPHGVLFPRRERGDIRKGLLEEDLVEAVVGLPANLFYGTGIPAAVLVLNRQAEGRAQGKVLFVEASREFGQGTNQNFLRERGRHEDRDGVPRLQGRREVRPRREPRGDREERLQPQHQPVRRDGGGAGEGRCRQRRREAAGA